MRSKLMITRVNTDPSNVPELGAPFFQATVAAAMGCEVEVIPTARAGELARMGVAENLFVKEGALESDCDDAHEAGARLKVCTPTLELWRDDLIPETDEIIGGAYVIEQAMNDDVVTFTC